MVNNDLEDKFYDIVSIESFLCIVIIVWINVLFYFVKY